MPEGPELRHSRDVLRNILVGKFINRLFVTSHGRYGKKNPDGFDTVVKDLPLKIESIDVKGKFMWWSLVGEKKRWYLWSTYGMSGQWSLSAGKHVGVVVEFNGTGEVVSKDQQKMFFNDTRRFGTIKFVYDQLQHDKKLKSLGPDVLEDPPLDPEIFAKRILHKPKRTIAEALMDQSCVSGVGNYLKAESLYRAGVSPHRRVIDLTAKEIEKLSTEVSTTCRESYADHGASIRTYKTVDDQKGKAQFFFRVYDQEECPRGHEILREETKDGRTSWWCSICQK